MSRDDSLARVIWVNYVYGSLTKECVGISWEIFCELYIKRISRSHLHTSICQFGTKPVICVLFLNSIVCRLEKFSCPLDCEKYKFIFRRAEGVSNPMHPIHLPTQFGARSRLSFRSLYNDPLSPSQRSGAMVPLGSVLGSGPTQPQYAWLQAHPFFKLEPDKGEVHLIPSARPGR